MLNRRRNARCTAVADSVLMKSRTQKILGCILAILISTDAAARLQARRALQRWYLKIYDLLFQILLCKSFTYHVYFRKYRRTKLSPSFLITLCILLPFILGLFNDFDSISEFVLSNEGPTTEPEDVWTVSVVTQFQIR